MEELIVVNKKNRKLGSITKKKAHALKGVLHRAFSVFVVNSKGEVLLQKRSRNKKLWPGFWSNTCCSHPRAREKTIEAAKRRLKEELGFSCPLRLLFKFYYRAEYKKIGSENEFCYVFLGRYGGKVWPNKKEVEKVKWIGWEKLKKEVGKNSKVFTPWLKIEVKKIADKKGKERD